MGLKKSAMLSGGIWTMIAYAGSMAFRFSGNIVASHLLAPQALGVMVVVNTIKLGVELLTDIGIEQNVVNAGRGTEPIFQRTAWTLQTLRGGVIALGLLALAGPLGRFYGIDPRIFMVLALTPLLNSFHSITIFVLVRQQQTRLRSLFELVAEFSGLLVLVGLVWATRSVWGLVFGAAAQVAIRSLYSYALPGLRMGFALDKSIARHIIGFGKWIFLASAFGYAAANVDRLILGRALPLALLGVFGLGKIIADMPTTMATRVAYQNLAPAFSAWRETALPQDLAPIASVRMKFLLAMMLGTALVASLADFAVLIVYDQRYQAAGWITSVLLLGAAFGCSACLNEATLVGLGKPHLISRANGLKLGALVLGLPLMVAHFGLLGAVAMLVTAEMLRVGTTLAMLPGHLGLRRQDGVAMVLALALYFGVAGLRQLLGLGLPWQGMVAP